jgi:hypothetical protein
MGAFGVVTGGNGHTPKRGSDGFPSRSVLF